MVPESTYGYDSIWAAALALNQTAEDIRTKTFENDQRRALENFSYSDDEMGHILTKAIESVNFTGVSVSSFLLARVQKQLCYSRLCGIFRDTVWYFDAA